MIEKFPVLGKTAFLLIGFVGVILVVEVGFDMAHIEMHVSSIQKFAGIVTIVALSLLYDRNRFMRSILTPLVVIGKPILYVLDKVIGTVFWPAAKMIAVGKCLLIRKASATKPGAE